MPVEKLDTLNYENYVNESSNVIIDFSAEWCRPCKQMAPHFAKACTFIESTGIKISFVTVDVDDQADIAADFVVKNMPTLVLIKNGEVVERSIGFINSDKIIELIGRHFDLPAQPQAQKDDTKKTQNVSNTR
jgi:thioredoxin 1